MPSLLPPIYNRKNPNTVYIFIKLSQLNNILAENFLYVILPLMQIAKVYELFNKSQSFANNECAEGSRPSLGVGTGGMKKK